MARIMFVAVKGIARQSDVEIKIPSTKIRRANQLNITSPEAFFRSQMFLPYLQRLDSELEIRFSKHKDKVFRIQNLIPKYLGQFDEVRSVYEFYQTVLESQLEDFKAEFALWRMKWKNVSDEALPGGALEALNSCSPDLFPTIHMLLKVFSA
jgi:hypothetical protein